MEKLKRKKIERRPSYPEEILKNIWLDELNYTQTGFAKLLPEATGGKVKVNTTQTKLSEIINIKKSTKFRTFIRMLFLNKNLNHRNDNLLISYEVFLTGFLAISYLSVYLSSGL